MVNDMDSRLNTPSWLTAALKRLLWPMSQFTAYPP